MKIKILILLPLLVSILGCNKTEYASLDVKIKMENEFNKEYHEIQSLRIMLDGKDYKIILPSIGPFLSNEIKLDSLKFGKYSFEYKTIFDEKIIKIVEVKKPIKYDLVINPDFLDYKKYLSKSIINNLKDGENVSFSFESVGCFHSKGDSVIISKRNNITYFKQKNLERMISGEELNSLIKFECQLYQIPKGGCTTNDKYTIYYKGTKKEYNDGTCSWRGWNSVNMMVRNRLNKN